VDNSDTFLAKTIRWRFHAAIANPAQFNLHKKTQSVVDIIDRKFFSRSLVLPVHTPSTRAKFDRLALGGQRRVEILLVGTTQNEFEVPLLVTLDFLPLLPKMKIHGSFWQCIDLHVMAIGTHHTLHSRIVFNTVILTPVPPPRPLRAIGGAHALQLNANASIVYGNRRRVNRSIVKQNIFE
jgi:hypothetical protein